MIRNIIVDGIFQLCFATKAHDEEASDDGHCLWLARLLLLPAIIRLFVSRPYQLPICELRELPFPSLHHFPFIAAC